MSPRILASVVVPAFDAATTIDAQLAALAAQRVDGEWEVLVADNGSSDDTVARANAWRGRVPGLRVIDASSRRGPSAARNIAAEHARGARLLFCDADDTAEAGWVQALITALETADAASGSRRYDALNDAPFGPADWPDPVFTKEPLTHLAAASSHNLAVRSDVFAALGGFDETMSAGEDIDFCWRLQLSGCTLIGAPSAVMQIRRRNGLRSIFRQAYAYGRADRILSAKFASIPVPPAPEPDAASIEATAPDAPGLLRRIRARGIRLPDPVFAADRLGRRLGRRFGSTEGGTRPFTPPATADPGCRGGGRAMT